MVLFLIIILIVIVGGGYLIFKILKRKKSIKSNFSINDIVKPSEDSSDDVEVLDIYSEDEKINISSNNYDLDDLFKTNSMSAIDNSDFDFELRRNDKK